MDTFGFKFFFSSWHVITDIYWVLKIFQSPFTVWSWANFLTFLTLIFLTCKWVSFSSSVKWGCNKLAHEYISEIISTQKYRYYYYFHILLCHILLLILLVLFIQGHETHFWSSFIFSFFNFEPRQYLLWSLSFSLFNSIIKKWSNALGGRTFSKSIFLNKGRQLISCMSPPILQYKNTVRHWEFR